MSEGYLLIGTYLDPNGDEQECLCYNNNNVYMNIIKAKKALIKLITYDLMNTEFIDYNSNYPVKLTEIEVKDILQKIRTDLNVNPQLKIDIGKYANKRERGYGGYYIKKIHIVK
jgi:hypothetical protein